MKAISVLVVICLSVFLVQAIDDDGVSMATNFLKGLYQETHYRSNAQVTPSTNGSGYNFSYGAGLSYNEFDLMNVGVSFGVNPALETVNLTVINSTLRYNGALVLNNSTNVTITGLLGFSNVIDATYDSKSQTATIILKQSVSDNSSLIAKNSTTLTTAKNSQSLSLNNSISQLRDTFKTQSSGSWGLQSRGTIIQNTSSTFDLTSSVNATSNRTFIIFPKQLNKGRQDDGRGYGQSKIANLGAFSGKTNFKVSTSKTIGNYTNSSSLNGTANDDGYFGLRGSDLIILGSAVYTTARSDQSNGVVLNTSSAYGVADTLTTFQNSPIVNGTLANITHSGKVVQQIATTIYNSTKPPTVRALLKGGWVASSVTSNQATSNTTNQISLNKSLSYATKTYNNINNYLRDCDDRKNKPVIQSGNPTVSASFKTSTLTETLQDLQIEIYDDSKPIIDVDGALSDD